MIQNSEYQLQSCRTSQEYFKEFRYLYRFNDVLNLKKTHPGHYGYKTKKLYGNSSISSLSDDEDDRLYSSMRNSNTKRKRFLDK